MKNKIIARAVILILATSVVISLLWFNFFKPANSFIAEMSGYCAAEENSQLSIAFTCFFGRGKIFKPEEIDKVYFDDTSENVRIASFEVKPEKSVNSYRRCSVNLDIEFPQKGQYESNSLIIAMKDGTKIKYPIGEWFFDIDEKEPIPNLLNTWESPGATSDGNNFAYSYSLNKGYSTAKITSIQAWKDNILSDQTTIKNRKTYH